jgi:hypothetical protein
MVVDTPVGDMARKLGLSKDEVILHRQNIMQKLQASTIGGVIRYAVRRGWIERPGKFALGPALPVTASPERSDARSSRQLVKGKKVKNREFPRLSPSQQGL